MAVWLQVCQQRCFQGGMEHLCGQKGLSVVFKP